MPGQPFGNAAVDRDDAIIDVGGGTSTLVDHLLDDGFTDITVLDVAGKALEQSQKNSRS